MNKFKRFVSLALVLCMVMAFLPAGVSAAEDSYAYNIVHVDAGRKYFSPENLMDIIDTAADSGYNQVQLYLSDNQGFRFALDDMTLTTAYGEYDLTPALGDGYSDGSKYPDYTGKYLTQSEMDAIIAYANGKGIDIVPCINVPGHMGAILEEFSSFRYKKSNYSISKSSIDLANDEAVAFALALTEKYAEYFASRGCKFYNVGADEYANDLTSMGFEGMGATLYTKFVQFLNDAADIIKDLGMTPRAFNDGFYYKDYKNMTVEPDKAYEVCYWSSGWSGYDVAAAKTIADNGHKVINTNGDYYWVLGNTGWQCSVSMAKQFAITAFPGGTVSDPAGAMFCIWCDNASADSADNVVTKTAGVITAFGSVLPAVESLVDTETEEPTEPTEPEIKAETDDATGIVLAAPGLTALTVTEAETPVLENAAKVLAWDMIPETAEGIYTGEAEVSVPVPADFDTDRLGAFVVNADGTAELLEGTYADGMYTYNCPHFSVTGIYEVAPAAEEQVEKTITVGIGATATNTITGGEYAADKTELDESIATVSVATDPGKPATTQYTAATVTLRNLLNSNSEKQATNYYVLTNDGSYYPLYVTRTSRTSWGTTTYTYSWFYYDGATYHEYGSQSATNTNTNANIDVYTKSVIDAVAPTTTVTFQGVEVGTTYVTVGNVRYTINVVEEDLSSVQGLKIEFWCTNNEVTANGATSVTISAQDAHGVNGILVSTKIPAVGTMGTSTMGYWKTTRLASGNHQTGDSGVNKTMAGTDFTYIRYYGGSWAYSADGKTWTNVKNGDQIVAYYMQSTKVTDEVTTEVVDWGEAYGNYYNDTNYVLVDYAVKYESGERTPNAFPIRDVTQKFHCSSDSTNVGYGNVVYDSNTRVYYRNLWSVRPVETAEYDVYMITLTPTSDRATTYLSSGANSESVGQTDFYGGTEKVVWVDDLANLGSFADESLHYTSISGEVKLTVGGDPVVPQLEIYNRHGMLVTYYVRAKATEDSLTVHYIDDTEDLEFYTYNIAVKEGTEFNKNIALNSANPNGNLSNGTVTNFYGRPQTVSADLSTLAQVGAQYLYTEYECIRVVRSEDGKHVYLYYTFDPTVYFVADFSLPMKITAADLSDKLENVKITDMAFSGVSYTAYGQLTDNGTDVSYKPVKVMNGLDYFTLMVTTEDEVGGILDDASKQIAFRVYIVPATTVHYEESFAALDGFSLTGTAVNGNQETELAGTKSVNYGFTTGYNAAGATNGTEAVSSASGDKAELTFTGTGIDVYANCDTSTSTMIALLYDASGKMVKMYQVDTKTKSGYTGATNDQEAESFSLPVVSIQGLAHGSYRLVLQHTKAASSTAALRIDGFRVYNTLGNLNSAAFADSEKNPNFLEVRNAVLAGLEVTEQTPSDLYTYVDTLMSQVYDNEQTLNGALVLGATGIDVQDLLENGPKNELFLWPGETLTFKLGKANAQIGLKAPAGATSFEIADITSGTIKTSADMFYQDVTGTIVIKNTGDNILSVTKLKLFGAENLAELTAEDVAYALSVMGLVEGGEKLDRPGAPIANPFADVEENSFYYDAVLWAVENGITTGTDATHFQPEVICQRATVVTFLWRAAGCPEPTTTVNPFADVNEGEFYYDAVLWAVENGITTGVSEGRFAPFEACNRAQVVTFLWRAKGCPASSAANPFADVAEGQWYTDAVLWAVENGVTTGVSENIFGGGFICNRAQIVTFLYRAK